MDAIVFNCAGEMKVEAVEKCIKLWKDEKERTDGRFCPLIFDEFNRLEHDVQVAFITACRDANIPVCVTCNPGFKGRIEMKWKADIPNNTQVFTVPPFSDITRSMFACEGVLECDELGPASVDFWTDCREKLSKQCHYDFGMRNFKASINAVGFILREKGAWDHAKAVTAGTFARIQ